MLGDVPSGSANWGASNVVFVKYSSAAVTLLPVKEDPSAHELDRVEPVEHARDGARELVGFQLCELEGRREKAVRERRRVLDIGVEELFIDTWVAGPRISIDCTNLELCEEGFVGEHVVAQKSNRLRGVADSRRPVFVDPAEATGLI